MENERRQGTPNLNRKNGTPNFNTNERRNGTPDSNTIERKNYTPNFNTTKQSSQMVFSSVPLDMYNQLSKIDAGKDCNIVPIAYIALRIGTIIFCIASFVILTTDREHGLEYCDFGTEDYCWFSWKAIDSTNMA